MIRWPLKSKLTPARIVAIYLFVGAIWILCSDNLIALLFKDPLIGKLTELQTLKGWFYVIVTGLMLYQLIGHYAAALQRSKNELQVNQERLEAIIETNADGILVFDREGIITLSNAAAQKHLALPQEQFVGRSYKDSIWPIRRIDSDGFPEKELPFEQVMQTGQPVHEVEYAISHVDDTEGVLSVNAAPLYDHTGNIEGVVASVTDITHHKQAEAIARARDMAEARNRAKSEFLAQMSHEIRTPLNAVVGLSQMLQREIFGALNPKQKDYVNRIKSSGDHLLELINDILDLSKVEAGKEQLQFTPIGVADICKYCLKLVQERAYERNLQLTSHIDPTATICIADERRLKQMLLNLLSNAIKFTPTGEVSLLVQKSHQGIFFTVADTGIGIASEHLPLVFEPFRQIDNELNQKTQGTGLGLALTRDFAHLHGGELTARSTLGQGSRFTIYLPNTPPGYMPISVKDSPDLPQASETECQRTGRIFIVDRDNSSAVLLQDYLQALGYQVQFFDEEKDFLTEIYKFEPQLILLDVRLPNPLKGLSLLDRIRQQSNLRDLPVAIVTAMAMSGDKERCLAVGANDYLTKPIKLEELDSILLKYIPNN